MSGYYSPLVLAGVTANLFGTYNLWVNQCSDSDAELGHTGGHRRLSGKVNESLKCL